MNEWVVSGIVWAMELSCFYRSLVVNIANVMVRPIARRGIEQATSIVCAPFSPLVDSSSRVIFTMQGSAYFALPVWKKKKK